MIPLPDHPVLNKPLRSLRGVGPKIEAALAKQGFRRIKDLFHLTPTRYQDLRQVTAIADLTEGQETLVAGEVARLRSGIFPKTRRPFLEIEIEDRTGTLTAVWFHTSPSLKRSLADTERILAFGTVHRYQDRFQMAHPQVRSLAEGETPVPEIRPVYPEIEGVKPGIIRRILEFALKEFTGFPDLFPRSWIQETRWTDPVRAWKILHQPPADRPGALPRPDGSKAWQSLAFFELLFLEIVLLRSRDRAFRGQCRAFARDSELGRKFLAALPFNLTPSQNEALEEIANDLSASRPMSRLLQGDVGSGKTVVVLAAAMNVVQQGAQTAIMAPTEILARQHLRTIRHYCRDLGIRSGLLVGSLSEPDKRTVKELLARGELKIIVGTQALFSEDVEFSDLGLVVIDEQHRFGVAQRLALRNKAKTPHLLVMTATPIPRTLAMTLYGDLDGSVIRGLPPGRQPVETLVFDPEHRDQAYDFLVEELRQGGQAFVVAPRIEGDQNGQGEEQELAAVEPLFEFLCQDLLSDFKIGLAHGRLPAPELAQVMRDFAAGRIQALVATTVIEVGVDVASASIILIEGAERLGLAQLHQLRGRVGRGRRRARCLLISSSGNSERLEILARIRDGFELAEEDLARRGPGNPVGVQQSGLPPLKWARLPQDLVLLRQARKTAAEILDQDPDLDRPEFKLVREALEKLELEIQANLAGLG